MPATAKRHARGPTVWRPAIMGKYLLGCTDYLLDCLDLERPWHLSYAEFMAV